MTDPRTMEADLRVLAHVGRMYLDALGDDPQNKALAPPATLAIRDVRAAVERWEARK